MDQKGTANYGRTKTPEGFPTGTPKFEFTFTKDAESKGYYSNKKYSVERAIVNVNYSVNQTLTE